jgi:hypothetical protein
MNVTARQCHDSPLVTTSSVISILTFVTAIAIGLYVRAIWARRSAQKLVNLFPEVDGIAEKVTFFVKETDILQHSLPVLTGTLACWAASHAALIEEMFVTKFEVTCFLVRATRSRWLHLPLWLGGRSKVDLVEKTRGSKVSNHLPSACSTTSVR